MSIILAKCTYLCVKPTNFIFEYILYFWMKTSFEKKKMMLDNNFNDMIPHTSIIYNRIFILNNNSQ